MNEPSTSSQRNSAAAPLGASDSHSGIAGIDPATASEKWQQEGRRHQRTPGAYEWWYFDAVSAAGNGVVVALFEGLPFHPFYLANVHRYQHRTMGTPFDAVPKDAQSAHYMAAYVAVFEHGRRTAQGLNLYPADGDDDSPEDLTEIRIGPNRITLRQDGSLGLVARVYPYRLKKFRPALIRDETIAVSLNMVPTFPGVQHVRPFRGPGPDGATHVWALSCPHGMVTGSVQHLDTAEGVAITDMRISTLGYHDHVYGQGALAHGIKRGHWGYLFGDDFTAIWHNLPLRGKSTGRADGLVLIQKNAPVIVIDGPDLSFEHRRLSKWLLGYPGKVTLHGSDTQGNLVEAILRNGPAVTNAPFYTRLETKGTITIPGRRQFMGRGFMHSLKLGRLRWPVLSDMVLMAIADVRADDPLWRQ